MSLDGRHAVVTGGGTGVGAAIARALHKAGASVTILGRTESSLRAQDLPYQICDVTDAAAVARAFDSARAAQGAVDIVIANAGAAQSVPFHKMTPETLAAMLSVNLVGVVNAFQVGLADMKAQGRGQLIAVASTAGLKGYPYASAYCAAKHAVVGLVRSLALELGPSGVTANALCPGFVDTPLLERSLQTIMSQTGRSRDDAVAALTAANPQRRLIDPAEVAEAALWFCSDGARSVNGHALAISGGEI
jgi:3-hydroxybutyrate dehydrogenase